MPIPFADFAACGVSSLRHLQLVFVMHCCLQLLFTLAWLTVCGVCATLAATVLQSDWVAECPYAAGQKPILFANFVACGVSSLRHLQFLFAVHRCLHLRFTLAWLTVCGVCATLAATVLQSDWVAECPYAAGQKPILFANVVACGVSSLRHLQFLFAVHRCLHLRFTLAW